MSIVVSLCRPHCTTCQIGAKAGVVVNNEQSKFASAHDLRRAFGTRWSSRVTPAVLQQLMRHVSIETMLKFYIEQDADTLARVLWESSGAPRVLSNKAPGRVN